MSSKHTKEETIPCWRGRQGTHPHFSYSQSVKNCIPPRETATSIPQNECYMRYWKVSHLTFQVSKFLLSQVLHWPTTEILKVFLFLPKEQRFVQPEQQNPILSTVNCLQSLCRTCDLYLASRTSTSLYRQTRRFPSDQKKYHIRIEVNATNNNELEPQFLTLTRAYDRFKNFAPRLRPAKSLPTPKPSFRKKPFIALNSDNMTSIHPILPALSSRMTGQQFLYLRTTQSLAARRNTISKSKWMQ